MLRKETKTQTKTQTRHVQKEEANEIEKDGKEAMQTCIQADRQKVEEERKRRKNTRCMLQSVACIHHDHSASPCSYQFPTFFLSSFPRLSWRARTKSVGQQQPALQHPPATIRRCWSHWPTEPATGTAAFRRHGERDKLNLGMECACYGLTAAGREKECAARGQDA